MWLLYAIGGGWGHVTRAASLARAASAFEPVRILSNSPHARLVRGRLHEAQVRSIAPESSAAEVREVVLEELAAGPSCFIVDTFPRGLGGELAGMLGQVQVPKVLVHRDLNPSYAARLTGFVERTYDLVLVPGEGEGQAFGALANAVITDSWLIRSGGDIVFRPTNEVVVCVAGRPEDSGWYRSVGDELRAAGIGCRYAEGWPAIDQIASASVVVGGGGYNTVYECLATGVPLVAKAWHRKYDRQHLRLLRAAHRGVVQTVETVGEAVAAAGRLQRTNPRCSLPTFNNGAADAAALIRRLADRAL